MSETDILVEQGDLEELTLDDLDQLDDVLDDDELDGSDPGAELSDEVDEGCAPDGDVIPAQGGQS
jgi:hypothetical protein